MSGTSKQIRLGDGRRLGYAEYGDAHGRPVLYFHGFPSSRLEAALCDAAARRLGVRLVAIDRPGYGLSDFLPGRRLEQWPDDVLAVADALGIGRFDVLGVSGGGPYALACAWKIPHRLGGVGVVGGLGPVHDERLLREMRSHARLAFRLARRGCSPLWLAYGMLLGNALKVWPALAFYWEALSGAPADRRALANPAVKARLLAAVRASLRQGVRGALWDAVVYARPWGFNLDEIRLTVDLWHGEADRMVSPSHTLAVAQALPHKRLRLLPGEGHFSLPIEHCESILGQLNAD